MLCRVIYLNDKYPDSWLKGTSFLKSIFPLYQSKTNWINTFEIFVKTNTKACELIVSVEVGQQESGLLKKSPAGQMGGISTMGWQGRKTSQKRSWVGAERVRAVPPTLWDPSLPL